MKMCRLHGLGLALLVAACSKSEGGAAPVASKDIPTFQIVGTPQTATATASATASATPSAAASASATATTTTAPATATTTATAATSTIAKNDAGGALRPAQAHVAGKNFALDLASPGCRAATPCTMTIRLATGGDYHINKEYPYKFLATPSSNVEFLGSGDANTFSRGQGDFKEEGEKAGTLTVRFKPKAPGDANVSGTYKLSVCSAENCQIEQQTVSLAVAVQ